MAKEYKVKILAKQILANNSIAFILEKPKNFIYKSGQFIKVQCLDNCDNNDDKDNVRYFAIASPPLSNELTIVYRMTESPFKKKLEALELGSEILIKGPYGNILGDGNLEKGIVFLVAGIGMTTAHSLILDFLQREKKIPIWLFYSNHTTMDTLWYDSLRNISSRYLKVIFTMTRPYEELKPWAGNTEYINIDMIKKYITHLRQKTYIILGRESFVKSMKSMLYILGIPKENIRARIYVY